MNIAANASTPGPQGCMLQSTITVTGGESTLIYTYNPIVTTDNGMLVYCYFFFIGVINMLSARYRCLNTLNTIVRKKNNTTSSLASQKQY